MFGSLEFHTEEITTEQADLRRTSLFDRVDRFRFLGRGSGRMLTRRVGLGRSTIGLVESTGHDIALLEADRVTFLLPLQGRIGVATDRAALQAGAGSCMLLPPGFRNTTVRPDPQGRFRAAIVMAPLAPDRPAGAAGDRVWVPGQARMPAIQGYLNWLLDAMEDPAAPLARRRAIQLADAMLVDLLDALSVGEAPTGSGFAPGEARVRRAEEFMRTHAEEPVTMAEVARQAGVGARALQLAFRTHRGASPRMVLESIRMQRARERLLAPDAMASVTDIALLSGFNHFGRFAALYRARFGESPSETLRRARR
jgi:AraC-like DNA-binding protein